MLKISKALTRIEVGTAGVHAARVAILWNKKIIPPLVAKLDVCAVASGAHVRFSEQRPRERERKLVLAEGGLADAGAQSRGRELALFLPRRRRRPRGDGAARVQHQEHTGRRRRLHHTCGLAAEGKINKQWPWARGIREGSERERETERGENRRPEQRDAGMLQGAARRRGQGAAAVGPCDACVFSLLVWRWRMQQQQREPDEQRERAHYRRRRPSWMSTRGSREKELPRCRHPRELPARVHRDPEAEGGHRVGYSLWGWSSMLSRSDMLLARSGCRWGAEGWLVLLVVMGWAGWGIPTAAGQSHSVLGC